MIRIHTYIHLFRKIPATPALSVNPRAVGVLTQNKHGDSIFMLKIEFQPQKGKDFNDGNS